MNMDCFAANGRLYVCVCFSASDMGNAKTNVEGQKYQMYSFYLAKDSRGKKTKQNPAKQTMISVLSLIYFHFCQ